MKAGLCDAGLHALTEASAEVIATASNRGPGELAVLVLLVT